MGAGVNTNPASLAGNVVRDPAVAGVPRLIVLVIFDHKVVRVRAASEVTAVGDVEGFLTFGWHRDSLGHLGATVLMENHADNVPAGASYRSASPPAGKPWGADLPWLAADHRPRITPRARRLRRGWSSTPVLHLVVGSILVSE